MARSCLPPVVLAGCLALALLMASVGANVPTWQRTAIAQDRPVAGPPWISGNWGTGNLARCETCHKEPGANKDDLVLLREYPIWKDHDKHAKAFEYLKDERGQRMGKILGVNVLQDGRCLACHGIDPVSEARMRGITVEDMVMKANIPDAPMKEGKVDVAKFGEQLSQNGVNCVVCHGQNVEWMEKHAFQANWRTLSAAERQTSFGLVNLRDPVTRAKMCFSCHIGAPDEGKLVTHEMYAAGHPPLPSIEMATFQLLMPTHWRLGRDIPFLQGKPADVLAKFEVIPGDLEQSRSAMIGAVMALRMASASLQHQARICQATPGSALDLTHFNCYACHHDLRLPSWRQERGYAGKPGRPPMMEWPTSLVNAAVRHVDAGETATLDKHLKQLRAAFDARPYGDCSKIGTATAELNRWLDGKILPTLTKSPCDAAATHRLLSEVARVPTRTTPDFDSARQIAWTYHLLHRELQSRAELQPSPRFLSAFEKLDQSLQLGLPRGPDRGKTTPVETRLPAMLDAVRHYDPAQFREIFQTLAAESK